MKICIDSDQTGYATKRALIGYLPELNLHDLAAQINLGYPDIAHRLAKKISSGEYERGILLCGTGVGMAMMANKVKGVFAGVANTAEDAALLYVKHHAQVLCIGVNDVGPTKAIKLIKAFISAPHENRINADRMREIENEL